MKETPMNNPIELGLVQSNSFPTGTGSYSYKGEFYLVVQNLADSKQVSIWAEMGAIWKDINAAHIQSLTDNRELWMAPASNGEGQFVAKFSVNGATYWDNNAGKNYRFPQAFDAFVALTGIHYPVVMATAGMAGSKLNVTAGVQNLAYEKVVGIVYSTDNWATAQTAYGNYSSTMESGLEVWHIGAPVGSAAEVRFAVFYRVLGSDYWDNNFWRNYRVTLPTSAKWADAP
jgi:hypothetical protein